MLAVRTPGAPQNTRVSVLCDSASPLRGQGRLLRSRSISGVYSRSLYSGLQPPCLRFAAAVTGRHARLGTWLLARLCRDRHRARRALLQKSLSGRQVSLTTHRTRTSLRRAPSMTRSPITSGPPACPARPQAMEHRGLDAARSQGSKWIERAPKRGRHSLPRVGNSNTITAPAARSTELILVNAQAAEGWPSCFVYFNWRESRRILR
jgi:hypothetical protein